MAIKIIGKFENDKVYLFDNPVVAPRNGLQVGDIIELPGEFARMYDDGKGLRSWFITEQVLVAQVDKNTCIIRKGLRRQFGQQQEVQPDPADFDEAEQAMAQMGTGCM